MDRPQKLLNVEQNVEQNALYRTQGGLSATKVQLFCAIFSLASCPDVSCSFFSCLEVYLFCSSSRLPQVFCCAMCFLWCSCSWYSLKLPFRARVISCDTFFEKWKVIPNYIILSRRNHAGTKIVAPSIRSYAFIPHYLWTMTSARHDSGTRRCSRSHKSVMIAFDGWTFRLWAVWINRKVWGKGGQGSPGDAVKWTTSQTPIVSAPLCFHLLTSARNEAYRQLESTYVRAHPRWLHPRSLMHVCRPEHN